MPGIFPSIADGGITVTAVPTPGVANAYVPPATFTLSCPVIYYGSDCSTLRFSASAMNALASEVLALAAAMTPDGTWNCASSENLATAFTDWKATIPSKFMAEPELV